MSSPTGPTRQVSPDVPPSPDVSPSCYTLGGFIKVKQQGLAEHQEEGFVRLHPPEVHLHPPDTLCLVVGPHSSGGGRGRPDLRRLPGVHRVVSSRATEVRGPLFTSILRLR